MVKLKRCILLDLAVAAFGLGSWLGVNGTFLQAPLLLRRQPEGWALPSWITLAVQLGNLGIAAHALSRRLLPRTSDAAHIYCLLATGAAALFLNAFLHPETVSLAGADRSLAFLALTFCSALVGCTSSVLFYPYLRYFREEYLVTYLVGEGMSGLLPSILALIQGVGGEPECVPSPDGSMWTAVHPLPLFDTDVFLSILGGLSIVSLLSFTYIHNTSQFDSERKLPTESKEQRQEARVCLLEQSWVCLLAASAALNCINNGVLNAVQSYSCMPYGAATYHLAATLKVVADPAICLAAVWIAPLSVRALVALLAAATGPLAYMLATALLSPTPPLQDQVAGRALIVSSWLAGAAALAYARLWVALRARRGGARAMRACGAFGQLGSILGTLTMFLLVNFTRLFTQAPTAACPPAHTLYGDAPHAYTPTILVEV
ncbi:Riboflavin transporter 2-A [Papilio xuthus]|uniref:Riboflavin transporter n=1 Tax=Papilio xuthus TaxID=66420 RepID=A0A194PV93_PAPXU|nr:Riboflavin transporter 2-A [Papilio xuthus]